MDLTADQLMLITLSCATLLILLIMGGTLAFIAVWGTSLLTQGYRGLEGSVQARKTWEQNWQLLAERMGLSYSPGDLLNFPAVTGSYRRRPLRLTYFRARRRLHLTSLEILLRNPMAWSLYLQPMDILDSLGNFIRLRDIEIGDPAFDQKYRIGSQPPEIAARLLADDALRAALLALPVYQLALEGNRLFYATHRLELEIEPVLALFDHLSGLADAVEREQGVEAEAAAAPQEPAFASDAPPSQAAADPFAGQRLGLPGSWVSSIDPMNKARRVGCIGIAGLFALMWTIVSLLIAAYYLFLTP